MMVACLDDAAMTNHIRTQLERVLDDPIEVSVHGALMHAHNLVVEDVLAFPQGLLGLSRASLLSLPSSSVAFGYLHHLSDSFFLTITSHLQPI
jgi:hypothetical protein